MNDYKNAENYGINFIQGEDKIVEEKKKFPVLNALIAVAIVLLISLFLYLLLT